MSSDSYFCRMSRLLLLLIILLCCPLAIWGQESQLLTEARRELQEGDHERAAVLLDSLENLGFGSPSLYLALGNAHFESGRTGRAVLAYERGLRLRPGDGDLRNNLRFVREEAGIFIPELPDFFLLRWWRVAGSWLGTAAALYLGLLFFWLAVAGATYWYLRRQRMDEKRRFALLPAAGVCLAVAFLLFSLGRARNQYLSRTDGAVLLATAAPLRVSPTGNSSVETTLTEGAYLIVTDRLEKYLKVRLADGKQGYVRRDEVEEL